MGPYAILARLKGGLDRFVGLVYKWLLDITGIENMFRARWSEQAHCTTEYKGKRNYLPWLWDPQSHLAEHCWITFIDWAQCYSLIGEAERALDDLTFNSNTMLSWWRLFRHSSRRAGRAITGQYVILEACPTLWGRTPSIPKQPVSRIRLCPWKRPSNETQQGGEPCCWLPLISW